ncbi:hypothetical protein IQ07DRAFT_662678 [Pyrenochaeta sp. DS3sAY3a]|nr:hypothetical protein IQ07DRAFT_662678 [Pyrenochaeta sp. DS3sAY3a]
MDATHRKIELQSPADLTYLTTQIRTAARQKLDLHLPPHVSDTAGEPDELRAQVESLVDAFVAQIIHGMRGNISINGMEVLGAGRGDGSEAGEGAVGSAVGIEGAGEGGAMEREEYAPFDEKLRVQLGASIARRDALVAKISQHRRGTPGAAAKAFMAQFEAENEALRVQTAGMTGVEGEGGEGVQDVSLEMEALAREDEVQKNWERAVEGLARLNKGLPETRARLERCGDVVGYLGQSGGKK